MNYLASVSSAIFSFVFIIFLIGSIGYLVGGIEIKGISLGTAGVLLIALVYGMIVNYYPSFTIGEKTITLFSDSIKANFSLLSSLGTAMFVTSVGLIAGEKFFRTLNKAFMKYIWMGILIILSGSLLTVLLVILVPDLSAEMAVGLMTGALTSTPGLSAAKEIAENADAVTAGYGIAYLFGVLGVVLFVQLVPRLMKVDIEEEKKRFMAADTFEVPELKREVKRIWIWG